MGIQSLMSDPLEFLRGLLLSLPGILLALCGHEAAHAWVAYRCGDPTAKLMGRVTLNPLRHLDPLGFLCMLFAGFGWAHPVPVNPNNFRHKRRDDLMVSLAGITANLIMCLIGFMMIMGLFALAMNSLPTYDSMALFRAPEETTFLMEYRNETVLVCSEQNMYLSMDEVFQLSSGLWHFGNGTGKYYGVVELLITPTLGEIGGYAYEMLRYFMALNLTLAVFNLIPLPPLDGYHVMNDLLLRRPLFASAKAQRTGWLILVVLIMMGNYNEDLDFLGKAIQFVQTNVFDGLTTLAHTIATHFSLI